ncbi:MAG: hypothetical protein AB7G93_05735 [Bdellovibrionales bacterium]
MTTQLAISPRSLVESFRQALAFLMVIPALMTILWADNTALSAAPVQELSLKPDLIMCPDDLVFASENVSQDERCKSYEARNLPSEKPATRVAHIHNFLF